MGDFLTQHLLHEPNNIVQTRDNVVNDDAPQEFKWWKNTRRIKYKGFWVMPDLVRACHVMKERYNPLPTDIILASFPKTGTTWLKALTISIIHIHEISKLHRIASSNPLSTHNPHELVPFLEGESFGENASIDINKIPSPRVLSTHLAYSILPEGIKKSDCKIVYICRNPWDTFVSMWHFYDMNYRVRTSMEVAIDEFCKGLLPFGPYFEHVLDFWQMKDQSNVFFMTYEELKKDPHKHVKEVAEFLNFPLSSDQVGEVVASCNIERLKEVEENNETAKIHFFGVKLDSLYRKGVVGDWKNHLSPEIAQKIHEVGKQKWDGTGLEFMLLSGDNCGINLEKNTLI